MTKEIPLTRGMVALVDDEDYGRVSQFKWHANRVGGGYVYATRSERRRGVRRNITLHRYILNARPGDLVDHINQDTLDCRRENLRFANKTQNAWNSRHSTHATGPYKGVYPNKGKFEVHVNRRYAWRTHDAEKAAQVYDAIVSRLRGEFAHTNFPDIDPEADAIAARLIAEKGLAA